MIKKIIDRVIPDEWMDFLRKKAGVPNQEGALKRLKMLGFGPKYILDIGAYEGDWASETHKIFPNASILMIEGQEGKKSFLEKKIATIPNSSYEIALLGAEKKVVEFNVYETASSVFTEDNETSAKVEKLNLTLLDELVKNTPYTKADFIKIDTQGYELEILKGGMDVLKSAQLVLLEVSFLKIYNGAPLADEIILFMKNNGFIIYDICSLMRRPLDNALFQSDFLFIKEDHEFVSSTKWSKD